MIIKAGGIKCKLFDAKGNEIKDAFWADTRTGRVGVYQRDKENKILLDTRKYRAARKYKHFPKPLVVRMI